MTSSQEPPLTRRELRERERLREQQETSPTPDAAPAAPAQPVPTAPMRSVPASTRRGDRPVSTHVLAAPATNARLAIPR